MLTPAELREYVAVMRESGILQLKADGLEITLDPRTNSSAPRDADRGPRLMKDDYNDLLFAATEGMPDEQVPQ